MLPHTHPSLVHFFKEQCYLLSVKTQKPLRHLQYTSTYVTSLTTVEHEQLPCSVVLMDTFQTHCPKYNPTRHTHALWTSNSWPRNGGVLPLFGPFGARKTSQIEPEDRIIFERPTTPLHGWSGPPRQSALLCSWHWRLPSDSNDF